MFSLLEELFNQQRENLDYFFSSLDLHAIEKVVDLLHKTSGIAILSGVGKSGLIAQKIAQTLTSTGSRALYLSPIDALHGDIGIVTEHDLFFMLSKSGESDELLNLVPAVRNKRSLLIAIVSEPQSRLAKVADHTIVLPLKKELCPFDLAPTTSTTIQMLLGDLLAISLMRLKNFSKDQFAENHPAGRIGKRITLKVKDLMLKGPSIPTCKPQDKLVDTLVELSNKKCGCILVLDQEQELKGIFTDGDLRRALQNHGPHVLHTPTQSS
jgi:arabinose-5-phosphate isomerase